MMNTTNLLKENELFFKTWLRSPKSMGSLFPSSQALARALAREVVWRPGQYVVELGAGTGAISQGLIDNGIPREALLTIELDEPLYEYLVHRLPGCQVVRGDATKLDMILAERGITDVGSVVSGLPMVGMPFEFQQKIVSQGLTATGGKGPMLQYTYAPFSPVPAKKLGIRSTMCSYVVWNFPPAAVWKYSVPR